MMQVIFIVILRYVTVIKNKRVQVFPTMKATRHEEVAAFCRINGNTNYHIDYILPKMVKYRYQLQVTYNILQHDAAQILRPMC